MLLYLEHPPGPLVSLSQPTDAAIYAFLDHQGALSQITKRIRIDFGVSILPYHHPVRVAERVAMVDQLTNGRIEVGTGRSNAYEQTAWG